MGVLRLGDKCENTAVALPEELCEGYSINEREAGDLCDGRCYFGEAGSVCEGEGEGVGCEVGSDKHFETLCCWLCLYNNT